MKKKIEEDINRIRNIPQINELWESVDGRGRTYGLVKDGDNPFYGSHITLIDSDELVIIAKNNRRGSRVNIFQYRLARRNIRLGERVINILKKAGYEFVNYRLEEEGK